MHRIPPKSPYRITPKSPLCPPLGNEFQTQFRNQMEPLIKKLITLDCKGFGNIEFYQDDFYEAIFYYTRGLQFCPNDVDLLSNRGFASLQFGCYKNALSDIEAVLQINPKHEKCLHRKVRVLWGLRRYEEALGFVQALPNEIKTKPDFRSLEEKCFKMIEQSKGIFDFEDIYRIPETNDTVAEYTGPVEIAEIPGKGRGLIATSDIKPGELIICSKAFVYVLEEEAEPFFGKTLDAGGDNGGVSIEIHDIMTYTLTMICRKLSLEPNLRESFFDMYAATYATEAQILKANRSEIDCDDAILASQILELNVFDTQVTPPHLGRENTGKARFVGLWVLPSYLNHCCMDSTASATQSGEYTFIRALKPIKKGEEVTIFYVEPTFPRRREMLRDRNIDCNCSLCQMEDSESTEIRDDVEETLNEIKTGLDTADLETQVSMIRKIISLRQDFAKTNLAMLDDSIEIVCSKLKEKKDYKNFAEIYEKIHEVAVDNWHLGAKSIQIAESLVECYIALKDEPNSMKWAKQLKRDLINKIGTAEPFKHLRSGIEDKLKSTFGIDCFDE